jgi:hypothetical protein
MRLLTVFPTSIVPIFLSDTPIFLAHNQVHERSMEGDLLLLELREILKRNTKIKVVLMSATVRKHHLSFYVVQV